VWVCCLGGRGAYGAPLSQVSICVTNKLVLNFLGSSKTQYNYNVNPKVAFPRDKDGHVIFLQAKK